MICEGIMTKEVVKVLSFEDQYYNSSVQKAKELSWAKIADPVLVRSNISDLTVCMSVTFEVITSHFIMEIDSQFR